MEDVKGELLERYKLLPGLSGRVSELENQNDELREKNRQMEQKLATMQVKLILQSKTIHFDNRFHYCEGLTCGTAVLYVVQD